MKKNTTPKTHLIRVIFSLFSLFFFTTIAVAQQKPSTNKYPATFLWRISGNGLDRPSYLYGTMHLTDKRLFYFGDSLYNAIEQTEGFAIEVNPDELSTQMIHSFTKEDKSGYLKDAVDKESYDRIKKTLEKKYGFKADKLTRRQAYLAKNEWMKDMRKPDDMYTFMDAWLYNIARSLGKWTGGIEDLEDQLSLIENEEQTFAFEDLLIDNSIIQGGLNKMIDMYLSQDLQAIDDFFNNHNQTNKDELLTRRNMKMSNRMDSILKYRSCFFAVGAAHLPGDSGVIKLLLHKGFKVEPVFSSQKISPETYKVAVSEMKWLTFAPSDSLYHVDFPSKSATMFIDGNVIKMEMCIDIPTSTYYLTAAVPNMRQETNKEKLIDKMLEGFTKGGKTIERKKINIDGETGLELLVEKDGYLRVRAVIKGNYAFMNVMGHEAKKEMVTGEMSQRFFSSFKVSDKALFVSNQMKTFANEDDGFSILLPQLPENSKLETDEEGWITKTYSSLDIKNTAYFMVVVRSTAPGYYLNGDSLFFAEQKQNWSKAYKELRKEEFFKLGEFPAMRYDFVMQNGKEKAISKTLTINRGNRSYLLLAITEDDTDKNGVVKAFFNSFQLQAYKQANWKNRTSPDGNFSTYSPAPIEIKWRKDAEGKDDGTFTYYAYDSSSAVSYEYSKISYVDYYYAKTDSALFYDALQTQIGASDSVISRKYVSNGTDKAQEVVLQLKDNQNFRRMRLVLHGDTIYMASAFLHPGILNANEVNKHFDEILVLTPSSPTTLYKKRTKELLADLASGDSIRFKAAADRIENVTFEKDDLPFLKEALLKKYELAEEQYEYDDIYNNIADIIVELGDSSIVGFIQKKYFSPNLDNEEQKLAMLRVLASTKTKESYTVLKNLLLTDPPYLYLNTLEYKLRDSLELTKLLFPEVMKLGTDTLYYDFTSSLGNVLLDSNLVTIEMFKPFEENLLKIGSQLIEKIKGDAEAGIWDERESLHLLGRINTTKGNALLQSLVLLNHKDLNSNLIIDLLVNKQTVPKQSIELLAADKEYRFGLYNRLQQKGLTSFFPAKYGSQQSLAESDVYNMASDEYTVESVVYLDSKVISYKGAEKKFYLFKVKVEEDGWYLGISGGYNKDSKILHIEKGEDVGGIYWDEEYNSKQVKEQFEKYIKEYLETEN